MRREHDARRWPRAEGDRRIVVAGALAALLLSSHARASGAEEALVVGSKRFAESTILAEIAAEAARATGATIEHKEGLGGTAIVFRALEQGDVDVYPDYTGTLVEAVLREKRLGLEDLRARLAGRGLCVGAPLGFQNTYALAVSEQAARTSSARRISDLAAVPDLKLGLSNEFEGREDGWRGLSRAYGLERIVPKEMDHGLAYGALSSGAVDAIEVYSTDAKIEREHLRVLDDDRRFFPSYEAVLVYRCDAKERAPRALAAMLALSGTLDAKTMIGLDAKVELDGASPRDVARAHLGAPAKAEAAPRRSFARGLAEVVVRDGPRHLELVLASLLLSVLVGVPLGVVAERRRALGAAILAITGVLQTIPALALLCFFIPLLGIGTAPTIVALFLYGLLPIVRNTHAGLSAIAPSLRESAVVLGLTPRTRLFRIELPLASRTMLAGIKTCAVIDVGTATVAAFVGAGGFGRAISAGLSLNDTTMILEGAIPAALLALVVEGLFALVERVVVPRGLRLPRA